MEYGKVYVVMCDGEVEYATTDSESAEGYKDTQNYNSREDVLEEWDIDDPDEKDIAEADYQAGYEGDYFEVVEVNLSGKEEDDIIELPDGTEIIVSEILEKFEKEDDLLD